MSRPRPAHEYVYATPNYYYDAEEYVGDYSENDAMSDAAPRVVPAPANVTEIYRRKPALAATEHYGQPKVYVPANYYYDVVAVPPQLQRNTAAYRRQVPVAEERAHYYTAAPVEDSYTNPMAYGTPQATPARKSGALPATATRQVTRRRRVTVRTPRYFRPATSNVFKKPSTLCLPVTCQPDPAVYRRVRKPPESPTYAAQQAAYLQKTGRPVQRRHSLPVANNSELDPQANKQRGRAHMSQSEVDAVLARYEPILGDHPQAEATAQNLDSTSSRSSVNVKSSKDKLPLHLEPKVPSTVMQKRQRFFKNQENVKVKNDKPRSRTNSFGNVDRLEVEEITTDVLDSMLNELIDSGCENKISDSDRERSSEKPVTPKKSEYGLRPGSKTRKGDANIYNKSFNYQDICQNMNKCQQDIYPKPATNNGNDQNSQTGSQAIVSLPQKGNSSNNNTSNANINNAIQSNTVVNNYKLLDASSVMELHKSKSYIISLIDRALSKELGTVPDDRPHVPVTHQTPSRENEQMDARQAIDLMNKNLDKMDKGLGLEITQALTDSLVSNATSSQHNELKHGSSCSCNIQDEPPYVKQLKQLRWGHLRHIQREVRRLEDLERFLDSCSSGSFM